MNNTVYTGARCMQKVREREHVMIFHSAANQILNAFSLFSLFKAPEENLSIFYTVFRILTPTCSLHIPEIEFFRIKPPTSVLHTIRTTQLLPFSDCYTTVVGAALLT